MLLLGYHHYIVNSSLNVIMDKQVPPEGISNAGVLTIFFYKMLMFNNIMVNNQLHFQGGHTFASA